MTRPIAALFGWMTKCIRSVKKIPLLYLIYDEAMIREATETPSDMQMTRPCVANSQKGLLQLMDNLNKDTREFGMKINVKNQSCA